MDFSGSYDRNLDAKGRLSLPATFRKGLEERVRVIPAPEKEVDALYVFTEEAFKAWIDSVFERKGGFDPTNMQHRMVKQELYGQANTLEIDSASRISLPEDFRRQVGLTREVTVVGLEDHIAVWDRATRAASRAQAKAALEDFFN